MIQVKLLSYHSAQRYALRQTIIAAQRILQKDNPGLKLEITELRSWQEIENYTPILAAPSLVVNETLVCAGRFPTKQEVVDWLVSAVKNDQS